MRPRQIVLLLAAFVAAGVAIWGPPTPSDDSSASAEDGTVTRVVDGDTIHVALGGQDETVRYIGIDTPESVKPGTPVQCFAKEASDANARLVEGRRVRLVRDVSERDRFGRILAYVYRDSDDLFVNEALVRGGYALAKEYRPDTRFATRLAAVMDEARSAAKGLWKAC